MDVALQFLFVTRSSSVIRNAAQALKLTRRPDAKEEAPVGVSPPSVTPAGKQKKRGRAPPKGRKGAKPMPVEVLETRTGAILLAVRDCALPACAPV